MEIKGRRKKKKRAYSKLEKEILLFEWYWIDWAYEDEHMQANFQPTTIMEHLHISERTLQRYWKDLNESGLVPKLQWITEKEFDSYSGRESKNKTIDFSKTEYVEEIGEMSQNRSQHIDKLKRLAVAIGIYENIDYVLQINSGYYSGEYDKKIPCHFWESVSVKAYREALKEKHPELLKSDRTLERDLKMLDHLFRRVGPGRTEFSFE